MSRGAWLIIGLALILAVLSVYCALNYLSFRTSRSDLVASDQRLILQAEKLDQEFGCRDGLVVVVENGHPSPSIAFAEALAEELRHKYPIQFPELFYRLHPDSLKHWALLYLEPAQLQEIIRKLEEHREVLASLAAEPSLLRFFQIVNEELTGAMINELFTGFLGEDQEQEKLPDLGLLNATLSRLYDSLEGAKPYASPFSTFFPKELEDLSSAGYFFTENDKYLLVLVTPEEESYTGSSRAVKVLRRVVAQVKERFPEVKAGVTGPLALEADEMTSALSDISLATWLSLVGQMVLLVIFLRSLKRTLLECVVLLIGLCWTFGLVTLAIGHLNLLSIVFAPLMLGLTIDYGIHWFCRLEEEQTQGGRSNAENLTCTLRRATPGIIYAALAAAVSFFPLVFTGFKGLAELGLILTLGVLIMLAATLVLLPCLVIVTERCTILEIEKECVGQPRPFLALRWRRPGWLVLLGVSLMALGGVSLWQVPFDLNPLHLQNQKTESVEWELKLLQDSRYSTSYGALKAASLQELQEKSAALKKLPTVSHVESILSFLPADTAAKMPLRQELAEILGDIDFPAAFPGSCTPQELANILGRMHFKLEQAEAADWRPEDKSTLDQVKEANRLLTQIVTLLNSPNRQEVGGRLAAFGQKFFLDLKDKWEFLKNNVTSPAPRIEDLPEDVRKRFVSQLGNYLIRVFPAQDIWDPTPLARFVQDMRSVDAKVVGDPVLLHVFTLAFRNACLWAAGMALAAITILLFLLFRSVKMTLLALLPLALGTGWTINLMWLLNIPFNQANVLFLPLILGEAIEFGIIIVVRWMQEESARAITLPASTAKGVILSALTTTVGFGSLMVSGHRGTFSLGLLATVGSLSVLLASVSVLPAFLRLLEGRQRSPLLAPYHIFEFRRWLSKFVGKEQT